MNPNPQNCIFWGNDIYGAGRQRKNKIKNVQMSRLPHSILLYVTFIGTFKRVILMLLSIIGK